MADKIAGIVVKIGADTTGLSESLESVNTKIKSTQSQLKNVNKLLKLDPTNTTLLTQKQKLLRGLKKLTAYSKEDKLSVQYFDTEQLEFVSTEMYITGFQVKLEKDTSYKGLWTVSFTLNEF